MRTSSPTLDALIRDAESAAASEPDMLKILVSTLNVVIPSPADPYLVSAALIEAIACNLVQKIPIAKQGEVSIETMRLLRDRLRVHGAI